MTGTASASAKEQNPAVFRSKSQSNCSKKKDCTRHCCCIGGMVNHSSITFLIKKRIAVHCWCHPQQSLNPS